MSPEASQDRHAVGRSALLWRVPLLLALACVTAVLWSSATHGLGVAPDSVVYLQAAESLLAGQGLTYRGLPLTHFPPAFPTLLAAAARLLGATPFAAARYVQALLLGISVLLLAWLAGEASGSRLPVVLPATLLFALSAWNLHPHLRVLSESLFLLFTLACFGLLALYLRTAAWRWLVVAALAAGLSILTRYIGAALIPPLLWAVWRYGSRQRRVSSTLVVLLCSGGPVAVWMARNLLLGQKATNRVLVYHPIAAERWREFARAVVEMALPELEFGTALTNLLAVGMIALMTLVIGLWKRKESRTPETAQPGARLSRLLLVFVVSYLAMLALSLSFFDASTNITGRMVIVPFVALTVVVLSSAHELVVGRSRALWWGVLLCLLPFALRNAEVSWRMARINRESGDDYTSVSWANSPLISAVETLAPGLTLYTNASDAIEFLTGRQAVFLPRSFDPTSLVVNPTYERELETVCGECQEGRAVVVYFYQIKGRWQYGTREELLALCPLDYLGQWSDGAILGRRAP